MLLFFVHFLQWFEVYSKTWSKWQLQTLKIWKFTFIVKPMFHVMYISTIALFGAQIEGWGKMILSIIKKTTWKYIGIFFI